MKIKPYEKVNRDKFIPWRITFFIFYVIGIFIAQAYLISSLYEPSKIYLKSINENKSYNKTTIDFFVFISNIANTIPYLIVLAFVYNFTNIYKSFVLLMVILSSFLISGLLKLILAQPRPFFEDKDITNHDSGCSISFGNPSGNAVSATSFYLTLWHIIFESSKLRNRTLIKYLSLSALVFIIFMILFGKFLTGTSSLDQIIFGLLIGLGMYCFIFFVLCVNVNDGIQFFAFMNIRNIIFLTANIIIFLIALLMHIFIPVNPKQAEWLKIIGMNANSECPNEINSKNVFQQEAFLMVSSFLTNFGAFLGLKMEYYFLFNANTQNWNQYNFEKIENTEVNLLSKIGDHVFQWNHTSVVKSIIRLILIFGLSVVFLLPFILISSNQNIVIVFLFKYFLTLSLISFSMFYLLKIIILKFRLDNQTVFELMNDNL